MNLLEKLVKPLAPLFLTGALALLITGKAEAQSQDPNHFLTCNSINVNADNTLTYPQSLVGIKDVFGVNEPLTLVYNTAPYGKKGDYLEVEVRGPAGEFIDYDFDYAAYDNDIMTEGASTGDLAQKFYKAGGYGKYRVLWYWNNQLQGEDDFTIQENPLPVPVYNPPAEPIYTAPVKSDLGVRFGLGLGYETGSNPSSGSLGNTPMLDAMPELYFEIGSQSGLGFDFLLSGAMAQSDAYTAAWGNAGITSDNPLIVLVAI